jgi:sortase A
MKIKIKSSASTTLMIAAGILLLSLGIGNAINNYRINHSPLDIVDTSLQEMDEENNFLPLVQSVTDQTATPPIEGSLIAPEFSLTPEFVYTQVVEQGSIPDRIVIPAINLDAPIVPVSFKLVDVEDQTFKQWLVPNRFAAGWQDSTALLGVPGNTVLNGHHNEYGEVFGGLVRLETGDVIEVFSRTRTFFYIVSKKLLLPERYQPLEKRIENAKWILPTEDERLTLVTCWPAQSNTHRLIIVAFPQK